MGGGHILSLGEGGLVFSICPVWIDSSSSFSVEVSFLMYFVEFQVADIRDALAGLYGVAPKIQCLLPKQVRRAVLSSVSLLRRQLCSLCGSWGGVACVCTWVQLHVGTPWACAVCACLCVHA